MTRRAAVLAALAVALCADALTSLAGPTLVSWNRISIGPRPRLLLWNASASAPPGLYLLRSSAPLRIGELVTMTPPPTLAGFMAARGYLPPGVPLLKHIAALPGQTVCRFGHTIAISGTTAAIARDHDTRGRPLPSWQGCRTLRAGEVFLLNAGVRDSFDGRYFGPLPAITIAARAVPIWTEPAQ
jgi:conjugative transfer signal peptidase TraF